MMNTNTYMINDNELEAVNGGSIYSDFFRKLIYKGYKFFDEKFGSDEEEATAEPT